MAQRTFVTGVVAFSLAAAALHVGTSTQGPSFGGSGSSVQSPAHAHGLLKPQAAVEKVDWTAEMLRDPEDMGRKSAQKELDEALDGFDMPPSSLLPRSAQACVDPEVMIDIEPDPAHTHLALWFDRDLDTLGDALQESDYEYQGNWMPWSADGPASAPGDRFLDREQQRLFADGREKIPGVLLYRATDQRVLKSSCHPRHLEIFIVGDSPTSGIDTTQFRFAIQQLPQRSPAQTTLKIVGPNFSGAGPSLSTLVAEIPALLAVGADAQAGSPRSLLKTVQIASGSVTDPDCNHFLPRPGLPSDPRECTATGSGIQSSFVSFGSDSQWVTQRTEEFLNRRGGIPYEQMASLTEDESSFGSSMTAIAGKEQDVTLKLTYPRGISHLRAAYQKSSIWGFGASAPGSGSINLNLDFDEAAGEDDAVPSFARRQMPVSQEGNLNQLTTLLRERNIRAVVLSATDVLDEIFVAQMLAREAPNVLVVIWDTDDLFLRHSTQNVFRNIYFVQTWPLIPENYFWSLPPKPLENQRTPQFRSFVSAHAEGLHVAVHYLLNLDAQGKHTTQDIPDIPDYHSPFNSGTSGRPPLWLSSVGNARFWPVALLGESGGTRAPDTFHQPPLPSSKASAGMQSSVAAPASIRLLVVVLCLLCIVHLASCLGFAPSEPIAARYRITDLTTRTPRLIVLLAMSFLGFIMLGITLSPTIAVSYLVIALPVPLAVLLGAGCLSFAVVILCSALLERTLSRWTVLLASTALLLLAFGSWHLAWSTLSGFDPEEAITPFLIFRTAHPLSGVSPLFTLLIALGGLVVYGYSHLGRLTFTAQTQPRLPEDTAGVSYVPENRKLELVTALLRYPPTAESRTFKLKTFGLLLLTLLLIVLAANISPRLFDGAALRLALNASVLLLTLAMLWDLLLALVLWTRLKVGLLDPLESSSLRRAFNAVGGLTWKTFWMPQNAASQYSAVIRLFEQSSRLPVPESTWQLNGLSALSEELLILRREMATEPSSRTAVSNRTAILEAFDRVQDRIARVTHRVLTGLKLDWSRESGRITAPDEHRQDDDHTTEPKNDQRQQAREEWVALVYLHFVRIVLAQVRSRLITAATLYFFLVWTCTCYPYLNRHLLLIALSVVLGILSAVGITIYASINRDPVLSRATNHTPGELDLDFFLKTVSLIGIPLVGFIASQFPEVGSFLFSWIEPGMSSMK